MAKFRIFWVENHMADVEAKSEDEAIDLAYATDHYVTEKVRHLEEVNCLGGVCEEVEEHGEYEEETCPKCEANVEAREPEKSE